LNKLEYLDYLGSHDYDELPPAVQATVDRASYEARRGLARSLEEPPEELPDRLQAAFAARTRTVRPAPVPTKMRLLPWLAAAGWLLFLGTAGTLLMQEPETEVVEKRVMAPAPPPQIITRTDTLYLTNIVERVRYRTVTDTVYRELPARLIYVRDTVYRAPEDDILVRGSSSLRGKERVLDFLISTD